MHDIPLLTLKRDKQRLLAVRGDGDDDEESSEQDDIKDIDKQIHLLLQVIHSSN